MIIREADLFHGMSEEVVDELIKVMTVESYQAGDVVFKEGDPADSFYIIEKGALNLNVAAAGGVMHVAKRPGEAVGWSSLAGREVYSASVECIEPTRLIRINKDKLDVVLRRYPASGLLFYKRLAGVIGERLIQCHSALAECQIGQ